ncbi:MAG: alpha-amylase family glycosyl hydrolase [Pseudomonadota bacterium]
MRIRSLLAGLACLATLLLMSCNKPSESNVAMDSTPTDNVKPVKPVVYQLFTRLFGNQVTNNVPWGTIEQNGVGKFSDIDTKALRGIRELGVTHIWYTGVPHHAVIRDYTDYGISNDDPDVVKGRAGSPYAVKDYYSVNPDLADDPARRLAEFEALIARTHAEGMKVIIDIVPNHIARGYESLHKPPGISDFGANDDVSVTYARDNNFYYVVGESFKVPLAQDDYRPLGGADHPMADGRFTEEPAKWTGNGARAAQPGHNDWYETVKVNYGVRPDGSFDFDDLPASFADRSCADINAFWESRDVPDSWRKFRHITQYWLGKGVDGFRYDMAEMVPVAFWSYLNCAIKATNQDAFLLAEVYNPALYRDYIDRGRMDYLYDKVGFYDTLRPVMEGKTGTDALAASHAQVLDIESHMLHFLENHDEQRIASDAFAGDARMGMPAMTVSALISRAPTMIYFGQEVGEPGDDDAGFGDPTRTTIFDYWGVPNHQAWMNGGEFDGGALSEGQRALRDFYRRVLALSRNAPAMAGDYQELHSFNRIGKMPQGYGDDLFSFARWNADQQLIVVANFSDTERRFTLELPRPLTEQLSISVGSTTLNNLLGDGTATIKTDDKGLTDIEISLPPLGSGVYEIPQAL